jgi:hypothetical protein
MSGVTDSAGEGWDKRKISRYFNERNNIVNLTRRGSHDYIKTI